VVSQGFSGRTVKNTEKSLLFLMRVQKWFFSWLQYVIYYLRFVLTAYR